MKRISSSVGWRSLGFAWLSLAMSIVRVDGQESIEPARKTATEWVKLQLEVTRLRSAWDTQRELLESSIEALEQRRDALRQRRDVLQARIATDARLTREARKRSDAASATMELSERRLAGLADKLRQMRPFLPPRLSAALDLAYRSLDDTTLPTSERLSIAVSILNRALHFDRSVTFSEELLPAESEVVMEVLYWGLGQAYALDRTHGAAFVGRPGETGWVWEERQDAADAIARLIDIHREDAEPRVVAVPARITGMRAAASQPATP